MAFSLDKISEEALYSIFDGSALLFLGAGFDYGNKNLNGVNIPTADELADKFMEAISETRSSGEDLKKSSGYYEFKKGRQQLLHELNQQVSIPNPAKFQKSIIECPWQRIYTTNYNNVISYCKSSPREIRKIGLNDDIPRYENITTDCLYINGYLDASIGDSTIVITNKDYESSNPRRESIVNSFRIDVSAAKFVFFLGYSMYDIDIARIMQNDISIKDKVYIISGEKIREIDQERLLEFGTVISSDCLQFVPILSEYKNKYLSLPIKRKDSFYSLKKINSDTIATTTPRSSDLEALIYKGLLDRQFMKADMVRKTSSYILVRSVAEKVKQHFDLGIKTVILSSKICNGKTVAINEITSYLSEFYDIYFANTESSILLRDIISISSNSGSRKIIVFDGYASSFYRIQDALTKVSNVQYLFSERSALFRKIEDKTQCVFGGNVVSFSLDILDEIELKNSFNLLSTHGFIDNKYIDYMAIASENGFELGKIFLYLFNAPEIAGKFSNEFNKTISDNKRYLDEIYATIMLSIIYGREINKSMLNDILGKYNAYVSDFLHCSVFREILVNNNESLDCSRVLAQFITKKVFNPDRAIEIAIKIAKSLRTKITVDKYKAISREILRYSVLEKILPELNFLDCSLRFYEEMKFVGGLQDEPLFWLQFGIACLRNKEFTLAKSHFDRARKIAGPSFDVYQIDNQYARLLLETDVTIDGLGIFNRFTEAETIIRTQLRAYPSSIYPFRSAKSVFSFKKFFGQLSSIELMQIYEFINFVLTRFETLQERDKQELRHDISLILNTKDIIKNLYTN